MSNYHVIPAAAWPVLPQGRQSPVCACALGARLRQNLYIRGLMPRLLRAGDRIQLKVRTISGWKGEATVVHDQCNRDDRMVYFRRDDRPDWWTDGCAMRHEVRLIR